MERNTKKQIIYYKQHITLAILFSIMYLFFLLLILINGISFENGFVLILGYFISIIFSIINFNNYKISSISWRFLPQLRATFKFSRIKFYFKILLIFFILFGFTILISKPYKNIMLEKGTIHKNYVKENIWALSILILILSYLKYKEI